MARMSWKWFHSIQRDTWQEWVGSDSIPAWDTRGVCVRAGALDGNQSTSSDAQCRCSCTGAGSLKESRNGFCNYYYWVCSTACRRMIEIWRCLCFVLVMIDLYGPLVSSGSHHFLTDYRHLIRNEFLFFGDCLAAICCLCERWLPYFVTCHGAHLLVFQCHQCVWWLLRCLDMMSCDSSCLCVHRCVFLLVALIVHWWTFLFERKVHDLLIVHWWTFLLEWEVHDLCASYTTSTYPPIISGGFAGDVWVFMRSGRQWLRKARK